MKTRHTLVAFGAAAVAAVTLNVKASNAFLSPRAAGSEIIRASAANNDPDLVALRLTSAEYAAPREAPNQTVAVAGANQGVNPSALCSQSMTASPKVIQACAANPSAPMPCCIAATK